MTPARTTVDDAPAPRAPGESDPNRNTCSTRSTCPYCGVGCGVLIDSRDGQITGVRGDPDHPANFGRLCTKGGTLALTASAAITAHERLLQPMRRAQRGRPPQAISWDAALDELSTRLADVHQRHGADAIGIYASGQLLTEDYYVFNKLTKGLLGTNNLDTNSRLCMSSAVAGYKATLGADAPPACYDDLALADTVLIAGANPAWAHPILFRRLEDARRARPQQKWIVVDPRRTETAAMADLHLALRPGSDVALFHGLLAVMVAQGWINRAYIDAHTQGFDALCQRLAAYTPEHTAALTGLRADDIVQAARWFATSGAALSLYCQGLNQSSSGTDKNATLINLHLACGQIGRPGAGPFSLTGQPNAMGGREVGGMANLLSAHRDLANPQHRAEVAALWGLPEVPAAPGKTAVELFEAAADGQIKALWIVCTNPAQSMPDQTTVRRALQRAEFVVVQEAFAHTASAGYADLLLPATSWGEKDGTVTNSERRISRVRAAVPPPGQARADWAIGVAVAQRLEARLRPGLPTLFPYATPEDVWNEHRASTRGRDLDITGLSWALLDQAGPQQWPLPEGQASGQARLYTDGRFATADGRARFADVAPQALAEPVDADYPIALSTGRLRDQWHGMSRTGLVGRLFGHQGEPSVDLHPQTLAELGAAEGDLLRLRSRRGTLVLPARADDGVAPLQAYVAMHWGDELLGGSVGGINVLTTGANCPRSRQPELKHCALHIAPLAPAWQLVAAAWLPDEAQALAARARLRQLLAGLAQQDGLPALAYASVLPFGQQRCGLQLRLAFAQPAPAAAPGIDTRADIPAQAGADTQTDTRTDTRADTLTDTQTDTQTDWPQALLPLQQALGLQPDEAQSLCYDDPARRIQRLLRLEDDGQGGRRLRGFWLAGQIDAQAWLKPLLSDETPVQALGARLLSGSAEPPAAAGSTLGRQVCNCFNVREASIVQCLQQCSGSAEQRLASVQQQLRCGTQCGSCLPELKRMERAHGPAPAAELSSQTAPADAPPATTAPQTPTLATA